MKVKILKPFSLNINIQPYQPGADAVEMQLPIEAIESLWRRGYISTQEEMPSQKKLKKEIEKYKAAEKSAEENNREINQEEEGE